MPRTSVTTLFRRMYIFLSCPIVDCSPGLSGSGVLRKFACPSPRVIPRADKFGLSLTSLDLNHVYATGEVKFVAYITSGPGINITSVTMEMKNSAPHTIDYSFMVIVVGYQPENTWMDLANIYLPFDPVLNPLSISVFPVVLTFSQQFTYASKTKFTSGTYTLVSFIASVTIESTDVVGIRARGIAINSTDFKVQYDRMSVDHRILDLVSTIMVYDQSAITAGAGEVLLIPKTLISISYSDYGVEQPLWGLSFNTKCIIGYEQINYRKTQSFRIYFNKTSYGNYYSQTSYAFQYLTGYYYYFPYLYESNLTNSVFKLRQNWLCFTNNKTQCGQLQIFYDAYTDACLTTGSLCPVSTPMPSPPFFYPIPCKNCSGKFCLTCQVSNRANCTLCDTTLFRIPDSTGKCICMVGYYQVPTPAPGICKINCTYNIPGCKLNDCTSSTNCTLCFNGFYLNPVGSDFNCQKCSINCNLCTIAGCTQCATGFVLTSTFTCDICSNLLQYCVACTVYSACTACQNSPTIFLLSTSLCKSCQDLQPNCTSCQKTPDSSDLLCNSCTYPLVPDTTRLQCISCADSIQDCVQCTYDSVLFQPSCTLCLPKYKVDSNFKCQECQKGTWIQRQCYYIIGCSSVSLIYGRPTCLACTQPHFEFHAPTGKCVCQRGYEFNLLDQSCLPKCGDSIKAYLDQECDDGNFFNADGCSNQCKVEPDFFCTENAKDLSKCLYQKDIKVIFDYILKVQNKNQAKIYFHVQPPSFTVSKVDWSTAIMFTFEDPVTTATSYENGILIITVDYENEIQGKDLQLDVMFDPKYIIASHQRLIFPMKATNGPLAYQDRSKLDKDEAVGTAGFVLGMICLFCYLISTFFHKMIGLETLQFIQLIYFSRVIASEASMQSLLAFNSLRYSNGYSDIHKMGQTQNSKLVTQIPIIFLNMNMKLYYLDNCNLMLIPIGLATLAYVYFSIKKSRTLKNYLETKELFLKDEFFDLRRKVDLIYGNFIFSYILSLLYLTVFSMLLYELSLTDSEPASNYATISFGTSLLVLFFIGIIFCSEAYNGIQKNFKEEKVVKENIFNKERQLEHDANSENQDYHPLYVPVYLLYQLIIIVLINCVFADFHHLPEVLSAIATIYMFVMIIWRPYLLKIHNFAIVFNQSIVVMFLIFELLDQYGMLNETLMEVLLYLTISLIGVALVLQGVRLYVQQTSPMQIFKKPQSLVEVNRKKVDLKDQKNEYLMENQINKALKDNFNQDEIQELGQVTKFNREFCHKVMNKKKLKIEIPSIPDVKDMFVDQISKANGIEEKKEGENNEQEEEVDVEKVKERLRKELNYKRNRSKFF